MAILLEDIQGKVQATMEAVTATRNQLLGEIQKLRRELSARIDVLELAVRQNSDEIRELKAAVRQNTEEIRSMREVLERKADREALLKLEARVQAMEKRLGIQ